MSVEDLETAQKQKVQADRIDPVRNPRRQSVSADNRFCTVSGRSTWNRDGRRGSPPLNPLETLSCDSLYHFRVIVRIKI
jgi:hypothetical protein